MLSTTSDELGGGPGGGGGSPPHPGRRQSEEEYCQWRPKPQNGRITAATYAARARDLVLVGLAVALLLVANGEYNRCVFV